MDDNQRLQLYNMIKANNTEDQTDFIRTLKHSQILRTEINTMLVIKAKYKTTIDYAKMNDECIEKCNFLFTYYTDIYNKIIKDEIDIQILFTFLDVLKRIENKELDQHEGSFLVGTILKELYIDSALKKADKLNGKETPSIEPKPSVKKLSYKQFVKLNAIKK